jgi:hypothetical protein
MTVAPRSVLDGRKLPSWPFEAVIERGAVHPIKSGPLQRGGRRKRRVTKERRQSRPRNRQRH